MGNTKQRLEWAKKRLNNALIDLRKLHREELALNHKIELAKRDVKFYEDILREEGS